jgi:hypothetical protein
MSGVFLERVKELSGAFRIKDKMSSGRY